ncbi:MAG: Hint domain-containing protein, partial [Candidatus Aenigmatarchaeota archaeon]
NYTYEKNQTGQVWIDKDYCEFYKKTTETSSEGTSEEGGTGEPRGGCLIEDSLILTPEGFKKIQELKEGDYVIGYKDNKKVKTKILEKSFHEGEFEVYFYKGYWFTGNHMVYLDNYKEFKRVDEISNIKMNFVGRIYNIQTETQNYFGKDGLLIHNK